MAIFNLTAGQTFYAELWGFDGKRWNGAAMVAPSTIAVADWGVGMVALVELLTSDGSHSGVYTFTAPGTLPKGSYLVSVHSVNTFEVSENAVAVMEFTYTGAAEVADSKAVVSAALDDAKSGWVAAIEAEIVDDETGEAVKQAIIDKLLENLPDIDDLTLASIATAVRDAILDRVLAGNHTTDGTPGKLLQNLDAAITSRLASADERLPTDATLATADAVDAIKTQTDQLAFDDDGNVLSSPQTAVEASNLPNDYAKATAVAAVQSTVNALPTAAAIAAAVWAYTTRTLSSFGTLVASIWEYATRTLTDKTGFSLAGTSGGIGAPAIARDEDVPVTVFKNGSSRLCRRVLLDGVDIKQADIDEITYTIYQLDADNIDARTAVAGHTEESLTVADVIYDTLQTDANASRYNFRHQIPIDEHAAFPTAGEQFLVEYTITPNVGQTIIVRFKVNVI